MEAATVREREGRGRESESDNYLRWVFLPGTRDALKDAKPQKDDGANHDPLRRHMQKDGPVDQPTDQDQEADKINSKRHGSDLSGCPNPIVRSRPRIVCAE
jgi:hypothetical protein